MSCLFERNEMVEKEKTDGNSSLRLPRFKKWTRSFTYRDAMQTIHAIDDEGKIYKGVHALAALYARTDLPFLAVVLESPGFLFLFKAMYAVWAKVRRFQF
jgi:predicted DCC family thiol-disulfide oxidoreductase YuxK